MVERFPPRLEWSQFNATKRLGLCHRLALVFRCIRYIYSISSYVNASYNKEKNITTKFHTSKEKKDKKIGSNITTNDCKTWYVHNESVNQGPWNILDNIQAPPEVSHDMLALRTIR